MYHFLKIDFCLQLFFMVPEIHLKSVDLKCYKIFKNANQKEKIWNLNNGKAELRPALCKFGYWPSRSFNIHLKSLISHFFLKNWADNVAFLSKEKRSIRFVDSYKGKGNKLLIFNSFHVIYIVNKSTYFRWSQHKNGCLSTLTVYVFDTKDQCIYLFR